MNFDSPEGNDNVRITTAMIQINGLSPFNLHKMPTPDKTVFLILPGPREHDYREREGIKLWRAWKVAHYIMLAGVNEQPPLSLEHIQTLTEAPFGNLFFKERARHTRDQAEWAFDTLQDSLPFVDHLIISTAAYHVPRGFLTCLQTMNNREQRILLSTAPVYDPEDPSRDFVGFTNTGGIGIVGEIKRIRDYQQTGDVASIETYLDYLKWRLSQ